MTDILARNLAYAALEAAKSIGPISGWEVVENLPPEGEPNKLYFIPKSDPITPDAHDEYAWINNQWEKVGSTDVDISGKMDKVNPSGSGTFTFDGNAVFAGDVEDGYGNKLSDSVQVSTYEQGLTDQEKANARTNIEAVSAKNPRTDGKFSHNRYTNYALGNNSVVLSTATNSFATQSEAIAIGSNDQIQTEGVIAIGRENYISGNSKWNTYMGRQLSDPGGGPWNALVLGTYNEIGLGESAQFIIGAGKDRNNRMNAMNIYTDGCVSIGRYPAIHTLNDNSKIFVIGNGVNNLTRRNAMEIDSTNKTTFNGLVVAPNIPAHPSTDGVYKLTCTVVDGIPEWTWEAE